MRWGKVLERDKYPQIGDRKIVRKFLFWPITLEVGLTGMLETRWLERAVVVQRGESAAPDGPNYWSDYFFCER